MAWAELEPPVPQLAAKALVKFSIVGRSRHGSVVGMLSINASLIAKIGGEPTSRFRVLQGFAESEGKLRVIPHVDGKHGPRRWRNAVIFRVDLERMTQTKNKIAPCGFEIANGELIVTLPAWALATTAKSETARPLSPPQIPQRGLSKDVTAALMGDPARRRA